MAKKYIDAERLKAEIERLKGQLIRGACAAQIEMETNCKDEAYNEVLAFLDTLSEEPDKSLEEAAENYRRESYNAALKPYIDGPMPEYVGSIKAAFIAGAKWQEKLDEETIKTAEDHAFLAGADWQKEQMMKEAVEGIARPDDCEIWVNLVGHSYKFNDGDKVHIIVLPKEEKK